MFFIFPAHGSQQLFMPPAGAFLSIAKERSTVVSAGFQPFARRENRDASSKPPCCIRHRRRFGILFVAVDKKYAAGGTFPTKEKHPSERKRKPAKRERIPTTSLRTGLGMTGLAYERILGSPIKSVPFCVNPFSTVEWRPFRRKEKIVLAFCCWGVYNGGKSIKGQSVRRLVRRRRNRVRSPASWSL